MKNQTTSNWEHAVNYASKKNIKPVVRLIEECYEYMNIYLETPTHRVEISIDEDNVLFMDLMPKSKKAQAKLVYAPSKKYLRKIIRSAIQ